MSLGLSRLRARVAAPALAFGIAASLIPLPANAATSLPVLGYQAEGDPTSLIDASVSALGSVGVDGVNIASTGASVGTPSASARAQLAKAHSRGKPAVFLVGNFNDTLGDFDEPAAYRLLSSGTNTARVVTSLKNAVITQGWDGIDVDIEALQARDTNGLVNFLQALRRALPASKSVSIAVTNYTTLPEFQNAGYDLWAIGQTVNRVELMAYDHHGFGDSGPGPIGDLAWQATGLDIVLGEITPDKVDLGVAGYGYQWDANGVVTQLSDAQARVVAGSRASYDTTAHEWTATLSNGAILWWSDARSFADRRPLATDRGVHGLAVWVLGLSDRILP